MTLQKVDKRRGLFLRLLERCSEDTHCAENLEKRLLWFFPSLEDIKKEEVLVGLWRCVKICPYVNRRSFKLREAAKMLNRQCDWLRGGIWRIQGWTTKPCLELFDRHFLNPLLHVGCYTDIKNFEKTKINFLWWLTVKKIDQEKTLEGDELNS